ncbi:hypothetical protein GCM10009642_18840 [Nocardiopsis metallicus]
MHRADTAVGTGVRCKACAGRVADALSMPEEGGAPQPFRSNSRTWWDGAVDGRARADQEGCPYWVMGTNRSDFVGGLVP